MLPFGSTLLRRSIRRYQSVLPKRRVHGLKNVNVSRRIARDPSFSLSYRFYSKQSASIITEGSIEEFENNFIKNIVERQRTSLEALRQVFDDSSDETQLSLENLKRGYESESKKQRLNTTKAEELAQKVVEKYIVPGDSNAPEMYKKLIQVFVGFKEVDIAMHVFRMMESAEVPIDVPTYHLILYGLFEENNSMLFDAFLNKFVHNFSMDDFAYHVMLKMYGRSNLITRPDVVFRNMKRLGLVETTATCNILLESYSATDMYKDFSFMTYDHMQKNNIPLDTKTFYYLIKSCGSDINKANSLLDSMETCKVDKTDLILMAYIQVLQNSKRKDSLVEIVEQFTKDHLNSQLGPLSGALLVEISMVNKNYTQALEYIDKVTDNESIQLTKAYCHKVAMALSLHPGIMESPQMKEMITRWVLKSKSELKENQYLDNFERKEWRMHVIGWSPALK